MNEPTNNRLTQQIQAYAKTQYALAGASLLVLGLFYFGVYRPQDMQVSEINRQIDAKKMELETAKTQTNKLPQITRELTQLRARLAGIKHLPTTPDLGSFLHDIDQAIQRAGVHKKITEPGVAHRDGLYAVEPIKFSIQGDFNSVAWFVREVEDMQRITRVSDIDIKSVDTQRGSVDATLLVNIYYAEGT